MSGIEWTTTDESEARKGYLNFTKEEMWDESDQALLSFFEVEESSLVDSQGYISDPSVEIFEAIESYRPE